MIEVLIDLSCLKKLKKELALAGSREIGGVLAAENLGNGQFRVVDISVQRTGGSYAHFVRDPKLHRRFMRRFFARTGNCSGQVIPDTALSFCSATAGASPSLN